MILSPTSTHSRPAFGWIAYFRLAEVKLVFENLDSWIRRRLRKILWIQWKKPRTRFKKLVRLGLKRWCGGTGGVSPPPTRSVPQIPADRSRYHLVEVTK